MGYRYPMMCVRSFQRWAAGKCVKQLWGGPTNARERGEAASSAVERGFCSVI